MKIPNEVVEIELTTACTRNCWFCRPHLTEEDLNRPVLLSRERHHSLMLDLAELKYNRWIVYCGTGEPTMHPDLVYFVNEAREMVPEASICLTTNGDLLTVELLKSLLTLDSICWDCYEDDETSIRVPHVVKESGYPPELFAVIDAVNFHPCEWNSRAGSGWISPLAANAIDKPCGQPTRKIFMSARGKFSLCCNDAKRRMTWDCSLPELLANPEYTQARDDVLKGNRKPYEPCRQCEFVGVPPSWPREGLVYFLTPIDKTRFWNEETT